MDDQPPHTVKDLLVELKDASELMVDLAYAAVFFNDDKIADEVIRLDRRSGDLLRRLRTMAMLAARAPDAEGLAGCCGSATRSSGSAPRPQTSRAWSRRVWGALPGGPASRRRDDRARADPRRRPPRARR
jgi:hypothetical protein